MRACDRLRALVPDCISKHMHKAAIFFAGKLCSMSNDHPNDVYLLAQVPCLPPLCNAVDCSIQYTPTLIKSFFAWWDPTGSAVVWLPNEH